ncbi:DUF5678 domain-containing protein [Anaerolineales bacterium HSG24]|nr:DUF5678 domain-containing protein [Anaerolineales bacterium HSG24]
MRTATIKPERAKQLDDLIATSDLQIDMDEIVDRALLFYFRELQRQKMRKEIQAFERQKPELLKKYFGEYVAIHEGKVIDHDSDVRTLNQRVFKRLGRTTVLHKLVTDEPERELMIRSPRLVRE